MPKRPKRKVTRKKTYVEQDSSVSDDQEDSASDTYDELYMTESELNSSSEEEDITYKRLSPGKKKQKLSTAESKTNVENKLIETGSDKLVWKEIKASVKSARTSATTNISKRISGPTEYAKQHIKKGQIKAAFQLIIDQHMRDHIISCTEEEASKVLETKWKLTRIKLDAFIAVLYARGAYQTKNLDVSYLWNQIWGPPFFSNTMSRCDFTDILRFLRFDMKSERKQCSKTSKFSMVSAVWDRFIENSQKCYNPGTYINIDEQLFPSKIKCSFNQYMSSKAVKHGIKFWLACDVKSKYIINGFPYLGNDDEEEENSIPLGESVVLKLMEPFTGCGRNVTIDPFFTSLSLIKKLLGKKTTTVGKIRENKRDLAKITKKEADKMTQFTTKLYMSNEITLTVYKWKVTKKVCVLSSMHKEIDIADNVERTPGTVRFYNDTKFPVRVIDQMSRKYSVKSKSHRWPLQIFFNILDLAAINAWILYKRITGEDISRHEFLFQLAIQLAAEYKESQKKKLPIKQPKISSSLMRKTCQIKYCKDYKASKICSKCERYVCGQCTFDNKIICKKCILRE